MTHSVHLGDREIFLAVQQDAPLPFYVGYMEVSYELGLARFSGIEGTTEYTEAWELFIQDVYKRQAMYSVKMCCPARRRGRTR